MRAHAEQAAGIRNARARAFALAGLMLLSTLPLWGTTIPPLIDLPGHMGRYHVELELARSPWLQRNWDFHWALIGNLGVDLAVVPLARILGLERAVWLIAALLPPLMIWGLARISRALHGRVSPFVLAAAPFALGYPYQYGFLNYWLGAGLAFHAYASWVEAEGRPAWRRALLFAPAAALIWLVHAHDWAILVVLAASRELVRAWRPRPSQWPAVALRVLARLWPLLPPLVLLLFWPHGAGGGVSHFFDVTRKTAGFLSAVRDQNIWLDRATVLFACVLIHFGLRERSMRVDPGQGLAAAVLLALIILMPDAIAGSSWADIRLWPIFFMAALAAIAPKDPAGRAGRRVGGAALALFLVRIAVSTAGFAAYDRAYDHHLRALDHLPRGASVAVLTPGPSCEVWRNQRVAQLASMAIVRRDAFVNVQWEVPGLQLLSALGARGTAFNADPSQYVTPDSGCGGPIEPALARTIGRVPRDRFGYVWLLGFDIARLPAFPGLVPVFADQRSALYRLQPGAP